MTGTQRDFWMLILFCGLLFTGIYLWLAYEPEANSTNESENTGELELSEDLKERFRNSFEEEFRFIENEHTAGFESEIMNRFGQNLPDTASVSGIRIIDEDQVNAFTTLGDGIYVYEGLISQFDSPDPVVAVIAHEMGHIYHNHVTDRLKVNVGSSLLISILSGGNQGMLVELGKTAIGLSFSRSQEDEADQFAIRLLEESGIHPQALSRAFLRLRSLSDSGSVPVFLSTHPSIDERIEKILEHQVPSGFESRPLNIKWDELRKSL